MEEKSKKERKNTPQNGKRPTQKQKFIAAIKTVMKYTLIHIHP